MTIELERRLRRLGVEPAPPTLLGGVLAATGRADEYFELETPIGPIYVAHSPAGISAVMRDGGPEEFERWALRRIGRAVRRAPAPAGMVRELRRGLAGKPVALRFDLANLREFERAVLLKALEIPRGEVRTYGWIASEIGRPRAMRAVGTALAQNPIPLFIPCHRVVRSDGHIGQYGMGGPEVKRRLLLEEGVPEAFLGPTLRAS